MGVKHYRIGIDVGLNSVGLAAIEINDDEIPVKILNAQSVIHDGGVDPTKNKEAITRKNLSGAGRRARRMVRRRRQRLEKLDNVLQRFGYPIIDSESLGTFEEWKIRATLAESFVEDKNTRKEDISIAIRHIARHRGWRNPYHRVESLLADNPYSEQYGELKSRAETWAGHPLNVDMTPAQLVIAAWPDNSTHIPRLRTSAKRGDGLLPSKLLQEDNANELKRIFEIQRVPPEERQAIFRQVFYAVSPKGSMEDKVGCDPLVPSQPKALKASLIFQRYRIVNILTNLRIHEDGQDRQLTIKEKRDAFALLISETKSELSWTDVAEQLGYTRSQLRGIGKSTDDGEDRVSSKPPRMVSIQRICEADKKIAKPLLAWWHNASEASQESMIRLLSNTVDFEQVHDDLAYADAIEFIDTLDEEGLSKLDSVDLPSGRAAYSEETLQRLTERMLTTDEDLHQARKALFGVTDFWRPPEENIGAPIGNPSADRVLKIVNQWLLGCRKRWGNPESIQIEHVRSGFDSVATAREYERRTGLRNKDKLILTKMLREKGFTDRVRDSDLRKIEAIQRQNGECLYCGGTITFSTCEMDHIVPRKGIGSTNTRTNLAAVCAECNRLKSNIPFAIWAKSESARNRGVGLTDAMKRVDHFLDIRKAATPRTNRLFKQEVKTRLQQTEADEPIDNRSIESVAWMADELHRRIDWYFNKNRYIAQTEKDRPNIAVTIRVFSGRITASARRTSGMEGQIHFFGARYKTRLDRRHHAVDAAVIALMRPVVAQTLVERDSLRDSQRISGLGSGERDWREYPYSECASHVPYQQWLMAMHKLVTLLNDALDQNRVIVRQPVRLKLGNSIAHDAIVKALQSVRLGDAMDADLIRRASTPALWCALTRLPDYDESTGLPVNNDRKIVVHGVKYIADNMIGFFKDQSAQIAVRGGSADIGSAIHHVRVYRCWRQTAKGTRKYWYGMIRVFQTDLIKSSDQNLFSVPLLPQSVSMRWGEPKTVHAIQSGNAEYLGWLVRGDEIHIDPSSVTFESTLQEYTDWCASCVDSSVVACTSWVITGFEDPCKITLRPRILAAEGLPKSFDSPVPSKVTEIISGKGWRVAINKLGSNFIPIMVLRRNTMGEPRWRSKSGQPCSWRWDR